MYDEELDGTMIHPHTMATTVPGLFDTTTSLMDGRVFMKFGGPTKAI